jgi:hypothetical protein
MLHKSHVLRDGFLCLRYSLSSLFSHVLCPPFIAMPCIHTFAFAAMTFQTSALFMAYVSRSCTKREFAFGISLYVSCPDSDSSFASSDSHRRNFLSPLYWADVLQTPLKRSKSESGFLCVPLFLSAVLPIIILYYSPAVNEHRRPHTSISKSEEVVYMLCFLHLHVCALSSALCPLIDRRSWNASYGKPTSPLCLEQHHISSIAASSL